MQFTSDNEYYNTYKYDTWDCERKDEYEEVKRKISSILIEQKISLSEARFLMNDILDDIERKNLITYICDIEKNDDLCAHTAKNRAKPSETYA